MAFFRQLCQIALAPEAQHAGPAAARVTSAPSQLNTD